MGVVAHMPMHIGFTAPNDLEELRNLIKERSFRTGTFTLSSGKQSNLYFNMKPTMMWPRGAELAARAFLDIAANVGADYVGGLEMGAVPVIGSLAAISSSNATPMRTFFVRKKAKEHGTQEVIEGLGPKESLRGKLVLVVDDVATSGKSILKAIEAARGAGGIVRDAACMVDREEGADGLLNDHGVRLHSIYRARDFLA